MPDMGEDVMIINDEAMSAEAHGRYLASLSAKTEVAA